MYFEKDILDTKIDNIVDSFVKYTEKKKQKKSKKKAGGESKFHMGSNQKDGKELNLFFENYNDDNKYFLEKKNLSLYAKNAKDLFYNEIYRYKRDISKIYPGIVKKINSLKNFWEIGSFEKHVDTDDRYYIRPKYYPNSKRKELNTKHPWSFIMDIALPNKTSFHIKKIKKNENYIFIFHLELDHENSKGLLPSYYISKFGFKNLGFDSYSDAFRIISKKLNIKYSTIKNMRDEFDPLHDNKRVGWWQRDLRPSRQNIVDHFGETEEEDLREIVLETLSNPNSEDIESVSKIITPTDPDEKKTGKTKRAFTPRGPTGRKAEEYFYDYCKGKSLEILDKRDSGKGYDFLIRENNINFFYEVKGMKNDDQGIGFTNKEWKTAKNKKEKYILIIVKNVGTSAITHSKIKNPAEKLEPKRRAYPIVQISWDVSAKQLKSN